MARTLSAGQVRSIVHALAEAGTTLEQLVQLMRSEAGLLPIGTPVAIGTLRALIRHAQQSLLEAAITDVQIEILEAAAQ
jgi:hypothetical protein